MTQTGDALTNRAYALAMQYGGSKNYEGFRTLDAEWDFISAALPRLLTGDNTRLQTVCEQLYKFLNFTGRWDDLLWLSTKSEERALAADDRESAGWRASEVGGIYNFRNQTTEALAYVKPSFAHWEGGLSSQKAMASAQIAAIYELQKDYSAAITAYREALDFISPESADASLVLNRLASMERANKNYPAAERNYREALRIAKIIKHDEYIAAYTGNLAELALDREQWAEDESLAREALALSEKVGRQELIARDCHVLAKALLKQSGGRSRLQRDGNNEEEKSRSKRDLLDEALLLSRRAVEIFTRLRQSHNLQSAQETLAEIEKAMQ